MNRFYKILDQNLNVCINNETFKLLDKEFTEYFSSSYRKHIQCTKCPEYCTREAYSYNNKIYYDCPTGYIELREEVKSEQLEIYYFKPEALLKKIAKTNNITYDNKAINNKIILFGKTKLQKIKYKFFYGIQVFINNQLNVEIIHNIKNWLDTTEKAFILTPQIVNLENKDIEFLNQNNCRIIELDSLLNTYFIIEELVNLQPENIKLLSKKYPLVIYDAKNSFLFEHQLDLFTKPFELLRFLACQPEQDIYKDKCIDHLWKNQSKDMDYNKQLYNHRSAINTAFNNAGIPKSEYKNVITVKDEFFRLNLKPSEIYIIR